MCRTQQQLDDEESSRIAAAALACFADRGFGRVTVREVARAAGLPVGRIYEHHRSKRAMLSELVSAAYDRLLGQAVAAIADAPPTPRAQLEALVWALVDFHTRNPRESLLALRDLEHLEPDVREHVAECRRHLEELVEDVLAAGVRRGAFDLGDPVASARSLLAMAAALPGAAAPSGVPGARRAARTCRDLAGRVAGSPGAVARPSTPASSGAPPRVAAQAQLAAR